MCQISEQKSEGVPPSWVLELHAVKQKIRRANYPADFYIEH